MKRLASTNELYDLRLRLQSERDMKLDKPTLVTCAGSCGLASGAKDIIRLIKRYIIDHALQEKIGLRITGCQGFCETNPFVLVEPGGHLYPKLRMEDVPRIVQSALRFRIDEQLLYKDPRELQPCPTMEDIPFFKLQTRTILGNNRKLDPIRIFDYIVLGGYEALGKVLAAGDSAWIIEEIKKSGLRGRGGAGFPTGRKWELARAAGKNGEQKYVVGNCDEGDPGAYMDRGLLEGNPHCILEGLVIAGIAIGATRGFLYVRAEYPLAIKHALIALRQARDLGLLGNKILGSGQDFDIEIVQGAGAFVCGEETALIRSVEGLMGEPRQRPPYPIGRGIWGHPTCINNVETLANVPVIINRGADEFVKVGVPGNTGTKIFSVVGKIKNTGLVEVPLGMKIRQLVYDIGGGPVGDARIKAVQTGGPSGGCIPASMFDLPIDYDSLAQAGSIMGSGGMIVMDENTCMVDVAKYFMNFLKDESCGKCFSCRKGTQRMHEILDDITKGKASLADLALLEELAEVVKDTTMCGLGQTASNPVLSTLRYFRNEYRRHIWDKKCDAMVCRDLVGAPCRASCPIGTEAWRYVAHLARGEYQEAYRVIRETNPFPSVCARVCDHQCEVHCRLGTTGNRPVAIRALKRFVTDTVDPSTYEPVRAAAKEERIAIVGSGPAGLTAAHYLSLMGYQVTVFEAEQSPGGMLTCCIPAYRLPREILQKEIESLLDENVTLRCGQVLGKDIHLDRLFKSGFKAVFLAMGAHKSRKLNIEGEEISGIYPAIDYLKDHNLRSENPARGKVGVIGGGDSAVDAARVALRQPGVQSVTILYRRTQQEMPALAGEVDAAIAEGVKLETLVTPLKIIPKDGKLHGVSFIRNRLGDVDAGGRRNPVPVPGTEFTEEFDTLIVTIGDLPNVDYISSMDIEVTPKGTIQFDPETLRTNQPGVFAGGDVATGPNTVVRAIAAGKRAAVTIDRYIRGETLSQPDAVQLPQHYVEPCQLSEAELNLIRRAEPPRAAIEQRRTSYTEVELALSENDAQQEAKRCLRCDLEFTKSKAEENTGGKVA
jgi:NADH-quinone oxidoreductase subunit F